MRSQQTFKTFSLFLHHELLYKEDKRPDGHNKRSRFTAN